MPVLSREPPCPSPHLGFSLACPVHPMALYVSEPHVEGGLTCHPPHPAFSASLYMGGGKPVCPSESDH